LTSRAAEIASDLRDALEQASLPLVCRVRRSYVPRSDRDDLERATLTVAPLSATLARVARGAWSESHEIAVGVQKALRSPEPDREIDELVGLVESIASLLPSFTLVSVPGAEVVSVDISPLVSQEHLDSLRQFTGVVRVVYRLHRPEGSSWQ
jgi:hypothetical protein